MNKSITCFYCKTTFDLDDSIKVKEDSFFCPNCSKYFRIIDDEIKYIDDSDVTLEDIIALAKSKIKKRDWAVSHIVEQLVNLEASINRSVVDRANVAADQMYDMITNLELKQKEEPQKKSQKKPLLGRIWEALTKERKW